MGAGDRHLRLPAEHRRERGHPRHADRQARHRGGQHLRRHGRGRAAGAAGHPPRVRERPGARIVATGCAVQLDPARWAALPGVHACWAMPTSCARTPGARRRQPRQPGRRARRRTRADRVRRPHPRLRAGAGRVRPPLHLLHHPVRPRPQPQRARRRRRRAGPPPGGARRAGGRADRRRHRQPRGRDRRAGRRRAARGAGAAAAAAVLARPGGDRRRALGPAGRASPGSCRICTCRCSPGPAWC